MQQYARPFAYTPAGSSVSVTLYEHCTSVFGEPTRGTLLDGQFGRASSPVLIAQPRYMLTTHTLLFVSVLLSVS
jgi:hypothetical protein